MKNLALISSTARGPKPTPEMSCTVHGRSTPPSTVKLATLPSTNLTTSSLRRCDLINVGNSTGVKSLNCQHTTCGTECARRVQLRHGRSLSQRTLRAWQLKQAPMRRTTRADCFVSVARGPLRPRCVGPRERASKHSKGLRLAEAEAERVMEEGVTMRNLEAVEEAVEEEGEWFALEDVGPGAADFRFWTREEVASLRLGIALGAVVAEAERDLLDSGRPDSRLM